MNIGLFCRRNANHGIRSAILALMVLPIAAAAHARVETFSWLDSNPAPSPVVSFHIHHGPSSGAYTDIVDVGLPTPDASGVYSASIQVPDEAVVFVTMTARDIMNLESDLSNEIVRTPVGSGAPPSALPDSYDLDQDTVLSIDAASGVLANDSDPESDPMTAVLVTDVSSGILVLNGDGSFNYIPDPGFAGIDSFSYQASDWNLVSAAVTVTLNVHVVDEPTALDDNYSIEQDSLLIVDSASGVLANDSDPQNDPMTAVLEVGPTDGNLVLDPNGSFTYTPDPGFIGQDGFTYRADEGDAVSNVATANITVFSSNLQAHWRLDEGTGSVANDSSGGGHTGTVAGPQWAADTPLGSASALSFDGIDDYVGVGGFDVAGQALTVSLWFKANSFTVSDARLISKATGTAESNHYWMLSTFNSNGPKLRCRLRTGSDTSTLIAASGDLVAGVWTHAAFVYDGAQLRIYKDGVEVGSMAKTGALATNPVVLAAIGNQPPGAGDQPFDGSMDDVRIFDRALTGSEIVSLATGVSSGNESFLPTNATVDVQLVASGFDSPVYLTAPTGDSRLFIVEAGGLIFIIDNGSVLTTPFLDLSSDVSALPDGGLLGMAFDPDYAQNGFFYVHRTALSGDSVLSRFTVSANPDVADGGSEQVLLQLPQPFVGQNGGGIAFDPMDGFLYVGLGDGGSTGDPGNRAQDGNSLLGKILRLDVGVPPAAGSIVRGAYAIPADNPFVGDPGFLDEIWALGVRNPLHFSFDRELRDLWLADEGQAAREEVNFEASDDLGGNNYGWDVMEGTLCNDDDPAPAPSCDSVSLVHPIHDYPHTNGNCAITGGYVYRGAATDLVGEYFFADFCSGGVWSLDALTGDGTRWTEAVGPAAGVPSQLVSFGEGGDGSLYILHLNGDIFGLGTDVCDPGIDSDCDGIPDDGAPGNSPCATGQTEACDDNCPFAPNPGQDDTGGLGFASAPDGIGNECQCGDVSGNGVLTSADSVIVLRSLLVPPTAVMSRPDLCDVGGSTGCSSADAVILLRSQFNPPTATVQQFCGPANP